mmetsp:Transcript_39964/g.93800  ORF Transcript_39964/g.93800 Transcript_39964/m.93800 type:complete len:139 (+) Transcript_39964:1347-1763(+)
MTGLGEAGHTPFPRLKREGSGQSDGVGVIGVPGGARGIVPGWGVAGWPSGACISCGAVPPPTQSLEKGVDRTFRKATVKVRGETDGLHRDPSDDKPVDPSSLTSSLSSWSESSTRERKRSTISPMDRPEESRDAQDDE